MPRKSEREFEEYVRAAVRRNLPKIEESAIFLAIMSDDYEKDAVACLQFGLAVLLDKPIYLLVKRGMKIAENVRRMAHGLEEYDTLDDYEYAAKRLLERAKEHLKP